MKTINPLKPSELHEFKFFFKAVKANMGFVPNSLKTMARVPALMGSFSMLSGTLLADPSKTSPLIFVKLLWNQLKWSKRFLNDNDRIDLSLRHMIAYVTSRAAGCQYCQAHTFSNAFQSQMDIEKLKEIWDFESNDKFTVAEKSALRFGVAAGSHPNDVTQEHFKDLRQHYSDKQIVEIGGIIALFGFLNRWNETFATHLEEEPTDIGNKYLKQHGWNLGKHSR